jgi:hypothetical protein
MHRLALLLSVILAPVILLAHVACAEPTPLELIDPDQVLSLLDSKVQRQDDKVIGRVINVFIDHGVPYRAIIKLDGFMGVGTHTAIVPWDRLRFDPTADTVKVVVDLSPDQIRTMAKLKTSEAAAPHSEAQAAPTQTAPTQTAPAQAAPTEAAPAERGLKLIDATLNGADDKALGRVTDLLVDRAGQPRAIVVALGGALDPKGRQVAVSWRALHFGRSKDGPAAVAAVTRDQAKAASEYEAGKPVAAILPQPASPLPNDQAATPR